MRDELGEMGWITGDGALYMSCEEFGFYPEEVSEEFHVKK